jgi:hypothetical protein
MVNRTFLIAGLAFSAALAANAQRVKGDWQGTLKVGAAELHLVVHLTADGQGGFHGALDSLDQGVNGIPLTSVSLKAANLSWAAGSIGASYQGKVSADGSLTQGTFTQGGQSLPLDFKHVAAAAAKPAVKPSDIDGAWQGTLDFGSVKLRIVAHIVNTADGLAVTLESPDQGPGMMPGKITRSGATVKLDIERVGASFEGKLNQTVDAIEGTFTQNGTPAPLTLKRVKDKASAEPVRPQNPVEPYPYRDEEVTYPNPAAGSRLAGTFTVPPGAGPFPAVLLICGSGPHDRDETVMGHKPFLVLADFASDAEAGLAWLKTRKEVDRRNIGLLGHSEGGAVAPMMAARNRDVAFIVILAGPGVRGDEILPAQLAAGNEAAGVSHEAAVKSGAEEREALKAIESEQDPAKLREKLAALMPKEQLDQQLKMLTSPWFRYFLEYDPGADLRKVTCAVLALNGQKDTQVVAAQNLPASRRFFLNHSGVMPEMDGREAVRQVRALEMEFGIISSRGVKIVMVTTVTDVKEVVRCFRELCDAYLMKPIDLGDLHGQMKFDGLVQ